MEYRNEVVGGYGGYPGGYGGCGFGGFGGGGVVAGLLLGSLFNNFRGNFNNGNFDGAKGCLCEITNQLSNIRADIGEDKYDTVNSIMQSTTALLQECCNGKFENVKAILEQTNVLEKELCCVKSTVLEAKYDLGSKIDCGVNKLDRDILIQGFENRLANCEQTNVLTRQQAECCCKTEKLILGTSFETQLRDVQNKADTDKRLDKIECLIEKTALNQELERLKRAEAQGFIANQVNRSIGATVGLWGAQAQFEGVTYPPAPYSPTYSSGY